MPDLRTVRWTYYLLLSAGLVILMSRAQAHVLPAGLASQIGHNSEALLFALLVSASVEFVLPWGRRVGQPWVISAAGAVLLWVGAWLLLQTGWTSSVVTLNEPIIGAGLVLLYITIPRPFRLWPAVFLATAAFIVIFFDTAFVLDQAESLVPFLIAPLALDVFDRCLLDPSQRDRPQLRLTWIGILFAVGISFMLLAPSARDDLGSSLNLAIDYGQRASEAYWGWILVHAYLGFLVGRDRLHAEEKQESTL